jgi:hypothetical protein
MLGTFSSFGAFANAVAVWSLAILTLCRPSTSGVRIMSIPSAIPWELISRDTEFDAITLAKARLVKTLTVN